MESLLCSELPLSGIYRFLRSHVPGLPATAALLQARIVFYGDAAEWAALCDSAALQEHWLRSLRYRVTRMPRTLSVREINRRKQRNDRFRAAYESLFNK